MTTLMERARNCRSWLFLPGADLSALEAGPLSGADVLIQELEDSVPPSRRDEARSLTAGALDGWRRAGAVTAVRVNPLDAGGREDLEAVVPAAPDVVMLPKVASPDDVRLLASLVPEPAVLVPNVESALGIAHLLAIASASSRVAGCLLASEDLATDLGADRRPDGAELAHARARFHLECRAAGVLSIDHPYTWSDPCGLRTEAESARALGYTAKSAIVPGHASIINDVFTPSQEQVTRARDLVGAFEAGLAAGMRHGELDGKLIEMPTYLNARLTLARAERISELAPG